MERRPLAASIAAAFVYCGLYYPLAFGMLGAAALAHFILFLGESAALLGPYYPAAPGDAAAALDEWVLRRCAKRTRRSSGPSRAEVRRESDLAFLMSGSELEKLVLRSVSERPILKVMRRRGYPLQTARSAGIAHAPPNCSASASTMVIAFG